AASRRRAWCLLVCSPGSASRAVAFLLLPPPPRSTLFPYTTLFRSEFIDDALGWYTVDEVAYDLSGDHVCRMIRWAVVAVAVGDGTGHIVGELVSPVLPRRSYEAKGCCACGPSSASAELVLRGQDPFLDRGSFDLCHDRGYLDKHAARGGGGVDAVVHAYDPLILLLTPLEKVVG